MSCKSAIIVIAIGMAAAFLVTRSRSPVNESDDSSQLHAAVVDSFEHLPLPPYRSLQDAALVVAQHGATPAVDELARLTQKRDSLRGEFEAATARLKAGTLDLNAWLNGTDKIAAALSALVNELDGAVHSDREKTNQLRSSVFELMGQVHYERNRFARSSTTAGTPPSPGNGGSVAAPAGPVPPSVPVAQSPTPTATDQRVVLQQLMRPQQTAVAGPYVVGMPASQVVTCYRTELRYEPGGIRHQLMRVPVTGFNPFGLRDYTWVPNQQYVMRPVITPCETAQCPVP